MGFTTNNEADMDLRDGQPTADLDNEIMTVFQSLSQENQEKLLIHALVIVSGQTLSLGQSEEEFSSLPVSLM